MCLGLPDDGAGALPLLRGVILNDGKSSTYKLALLRAIARVADATPALAAPRQDEDAVDIPLGVVALNWIRMYCRSSPRAFRRRCAMPGPRGSALSKQAFVS